MIENGKVWPPLGAIACKLQCNSSFIVMYEGLWRKFAQLLPLITGGIIKKYLSEKDKSQEFWERENQNNN